MEQNNYDFIMSQTPQKKNLFGGGKKQRIVLAAGIGIAILILIIFIASLLFGNKSDAATVLAPVGAAQNDLIDITTLGTENARDTALVNKSASANLIISSQNNTINAQLGKNAKKLTAPYQNDGYKKELEEAKNAGSFDKEYAAILSNRLDLYRQSLVTAYSNATTAKLKKELESYYSQIGVLIGEPTTPQQQ